MNKRRGVTRSQRTRDAATDAKSSRLFNQIVQAPRQIIERALGLLLAQAAPDTIDAVQQACFDDDKQRESPSSAGSSTTLSRYQEPNTGQKDALCGAFGFLLTDELLRTAKRVCRRWKYLIATGAGLRESWAHSATTFGDDQVAQLYQNGLTPAAISNLVRVPTVSLDGSRAMLRRLHQFPNLTSVGFHLNDRSPHDSDADDDESELEDDDLTGDDVRSFVATMPKLRVLKLGGNYYSRMNGVEGLSGALCTQLQVLECRNYLTLHQVRVLRQLPALTALRMRVSVTPENVAICAELGKLAKLEHLGLTNSGLVAGALDALTKDDAWCARMRSLDLDHSHVFSQESKHCLRKLTSLTDLNLDFVDVCRDKEALSTILQAMRGLRRFRAASFRCSSAQDLAILPPSIEQLRLWCLCAPSIAHVRKACPALVRVDLSYNCNRDSDHAKNATSTCMCLWDEKDCAPIKRGALGPP